MEGEGEREGGREQELGEGRRGERKDNNRQKGEWGVGEVVRYRETDTDR